MDRTVGTLAIGPFGIGTRAVAILALVLILISSAGTSLLSSAGAFAAAQDELPVADAGPDINATVDDEVELNGSASTGFEGPGDLNYTWRVVFKGNTTILYNITATISFNESGRADVNLTVRDSLNRTDWDIMYIVVREPPKTWLERSLWTIVGTCILGAIVAWFLALVIRKLRRHEPIITDAGREKMRLARKKYAKITKQLLRNPMGALGVAILVFFGTLAVIGPWITPYPVKEIAHFDDLLPPSKTNWMGTDSYGVDIFSQLLYGARTSMIVGVFSAIIASFLGAAVGLYSGFVGGWKDEVVMRFNDVVLSIPWLVLMIIVAAMMGKIDLIGIILIIGLTGWSMTARMVRAQVLSVKERQYIERARAIGSSEMAIIRRHIFPNTFPLVFANTILTVAVSILSEATLSFLGTWPVDEVTWGTMLSYAAEASAFQNNMHTWILVPGLCIVAVVLGFTLLGYALDEILNPKLRRR